ncbi:MAG: hypothetical protein LBQ54_11145 [Planctomycetaceae bacterium]|nr:hypothetical protein [Planctomycetaceae bacterium]
MTQAGRDAAAGGWSYRSESHRPAPDGRWSPQAEQRFQRRPTAQPGGKCLPGFPGCNVLRWRLQ